MGQEGGARWVGVPHLLRLCESGQRKILVGGHVGSRSTDS